MASIEEQESGRRSFSTLPRSISNATATQARPSSHDFHPFTTYVMAVITDPAQLQSSSSTRPLSQTTPYSHASNASASTSSASSSLTRSRHITRVGTVVSETEIPDAWAPKYLQSEHARQTKFLMGMCMMFVLMIIMVVGFSWWKNSWSSKIVRSAVARHVRKRAADEEVVQVSVEFGKSE